MEANENENTTVQNLQKGWQQRPSQERNILQYSLPQETNMQPNPTPKGTGKEIANKA